MKKVAAFMVSILIGMTMVIYSYAAENALSIPEEKYIDVNGIYISDFNNVSIGKINGDEIRIGNVNISVVTEATDRVIRYAVNEVKSTDEAFDYVRNIVGTDDIKVFFFNNLEESNDLDDDELKLKIFGFDGHIRPTVYFIDNEGNKQVLSAEFIDGVLVTSLAKSGFVVIKTANIDDTSSNSSSSDSINCGEKSGKAEIANSNKIGAVSNRDNPSVIKNPTSDNSTAVPTAAPADLTSSETSSEGDLNSNSLPTNGITSSNNNDSTDSPATGITAGISVGTIVLGAIMIVLGKKKNE